MTLVPEQTDAAQSKKRNFPPPPSPAATHFFERPGPALVICIHRRLGFHMGSIENRQIWSHDPSPSPAIYKAHPDFARIASCWPTIEDAKSYLIAKVSFGIWKELSFLAVNADIAESPRDSLNRVDNIPVPHVSIEAASFHTGLFAPLSIHRLDPAMRRAKQSGQNVTLGPLKARSDVTA